MVALDPSLILLLIHTRPSQKLPNKVVFYLRRGVGHINIVPLLLSSESVSLLFYLKETQLRFW